MAGASATAPRSARPVTWAGAVYSAVGLQAAAAVVLLLLFPLLLVLPPVAAVLAVVLLVLELRAWRRPTADLPVDPVASAFVVDRQRTALLANLVVVTLAVVAAVGFTIGSAPLETIGSNALGPAAVALVLDLAWLRRADLAAAERAVLAGAEAGPRGLVLTARAAAAAVTLLTAAGAVTGTVGLLAALTS